MQQTELQEQMLNMQQQLEEKDINKNAEEEKKYIIQDLANRLDKVEKQLQITTTPRKSGGVRRKRILHNITRAANLSPSARILYNNCVTLKNRNKYLKRLVKQQRTVHKKT